MSSVKVLAGQSLVDIAVQHLGDASWAYQIALLNNMAVSDFLTAGTYLKVPKATNQRVVNYLAEGGWKPASLEVFTDLEGIDFDIIEQSLIII